MTRIFRLLTVASILISLAGLPGISLTHAALAGPADTVYDPSEKGPFEVGFTSFQLVDSSRPGDGSTYPHRPIPVFVWYPVDPQSLPAFADLARYQLDPLYGVLPEVGSSSFEKYGIDRAYQEPPVSSQRPFPLLMVSHGWHGLGATPSAHASVGTRLASHGFVVAVLYHFGDQRWPWEPVFDHVSAASYNRPRDVSFALTGLLERNGTPGDLLFGAIRPDQVAAGGHSLGGYAAMVLAGGDDEVCDLAGLLDPTPPPPWTCAPSLPDPRIKAIVLRDGSNQLMHFSELSRIKVPTLGLGQEWSMLESQGIASWQARQHAAISSHPSYRVDVFNTIHQSFPDICESVQVFGDMGIMSPAAVASRLAALCSPYTPTSEVHRLVSKYTIAFLKTHLAGEPGYQQILTPGWALAKERNIEFFVTEKRNPNSIDEDWPSDFLYFPHQPGSDQARAEKDAATVPGLDDLP